MEFLEGKTMKHLNAGRPMDLAAAGTSAAPGQVHVAPEKKSAKKLWPIVFTAVEKSGSRF